MSDIENKIKSAEESLLAGEVREAQKMLEELPSRRRISRTERCTVAELARRADRPELGLRLLFPVIRPRRGISDANEREKACYGSCLIKIGAVNEGLFVLDEVKEENIPEVLLYRAFGLFAHWEYREAIPLLEKYVRTPTLQDYKRTVGELNLLASYVYEKSSAATALSEKILRESRERKYRRIEGMALQLAAQDRVRAGDTTTASEFLGEAEKLLAFEDLEAFFVRKWQLFCELKKNGWTARVVGPMKDLRKEALERKHWETLRQCDFYEAKVRGDKELLQRLYFGTPFESFRAQVKEELSGTLPPSYLWKLYDTQVREPELDLHRSEWSGASLELKAGHLLYVALSTFTSDIYGSFRMAQLYGVLFPGEFYDPMRGHQRIHNVINRLRRYFQRHGIPLDILEEDTTYRLVATGPCAIRLSQKDFTQKGSFILDKIRERWVSEAFSATEVQKLVQVSQPTVSRFLRASQKSGLLVRVGKGKSTRYKLVA